MIGPFTLNNLANAGGGLVMAALGLVVYLVAPTQRAHRIFAVFAATFGLAFVASNLLIEANVAAPYKRVGFLLFALFATTAAVALVRLVHAWPPAPPSEDRRRTAMVGLVLGGSHAGLWIAALTLAWDGAAASAYTGELTLGLWGAVVGLSAFMGAATTSLWVLAARFRRFDATETLRSQAAIVAIALTLYWGFSAGAGTNDRASLISGGPTDLFTGAVHVFFLVIVAGAWLWAWYEPGTPVIARNTAWIILALPTLGMLYGISPVKFGGYGLTRLMTVATLAYGVLRTKLFGIDLQLKLALRKSTVAAIFIAVFFVISELGVAFFESRTQSQVLGILSAALLVFAITPLQRFAAHVADRAMPGVRADEEYLDARKLEVYQAALEEALDASGSITATHADYLSRLRSRLGISERDHAVLQQALTNTRHMGDPGPSHLPGGLALGRYRIGDPLGAGAHGTTYAAHDEQLDRQVVLKVLHGRGEDPGRILREARATCQLNHPNIVTVFDIERVGDDVYMVMENVPGGSMRDRLDDGPLPDAQFRSIAIGLLSALEHVHAKGGIHRDVKPANVLLTEDGRAKLADFGIASLPGHEITVELTGSDGAIGTVRYMSPEQAKGQLVDHRSDLYSAAVTLFEAYTGTPYVEPRKGESAIETQMRVCRATGLDRSRLPSDAAPELVDALEQALRPNPRGRVGSAAAMGDALAAALTQEGSL